MHSVYLKLNWLQFAKRTLEILISQLAASVNQILELQKQSGTWINSYLPLKLIYVCAAT